MADLTEAGRQLSDTLRYLDISWRDRDGNSLNESLIRAIEAQAAAAERARLRAAVEAANARDDNETDSGYLDRDTVAAVLALLEEPR